MVLAEDPSFVDESLARHLHVAAVVVLRDELFDLKDGGGGCDGRGVGGGEGEAGGGGEADGEC